MARAFVFYNPLAGNGQCGEDCRMLEVILEDPITYCDMTKAETYEDTLFSMEPEDYLILCGGDGTLNRFINILAEIDLPNEVFYFPLGTGNDFARDLGSSFCSNPFPIKEYLRDLPTVTVHQKTVRFLNGVGFGIDGYCSEEGDRLRTKGVTDIDYTKIAVKGLLSRYKPTSATVTVDGAVHRYQKVWLAPTMHGRFYGGGIMPTPDQSRNSDPKKLSVMVLHDAGRLRTLMMFPSIFKGKHLKYKKYVDILSGREITVEFDRPTVLQIDGETVKHVRTYTASVAAPSPYCARASDICQRK